VDLREGGELTWDEEQVALDSAQAALEALGVGDLPDIE